MATPARIQEVSTAIATAFEMSDHIKKVRTYPVPYEQLEYKDGLLTLSASTDTQTMRRAAPQIVEWDLQIMLSSDIQSEGKKVEAEVGQMLAADSDSSLWGTLRGMRSIDQTDRYGSPQLSELTVDHVQLGDNSIITLVTGKVQARI